MKGCSAVPVMGRVRHAATRDRDHRGHESVEKPMAIGKQKKIIPLNLGNKKRFFFCAAKKGGWIGLCCCSINQEVDKGHLRLQMPIVWLRLQLRMFHALPLPDDIICMYIYIMIYIY